MFQLLIQSSAPVISFIEKPHLVWKNAFAHSTELPVVLINESASDSHFTDNILDSGIQCGIFPVICREHEIHPSAGQQFLYPGAVLGLIDRNGLSAVARIIFMQGTSENPSPI